jgi:hypothetical protein
MTPHAYLMADPATDPQNTVSGVLEKVDLIAKQGLLKTDLGREVAFQIPQTGTLSQFVRGSTCHPQTR